MGTMILAAGSTKSGGNPTFTFIILAVLVGLFYLLIMRPQRNRQRQARQTQSQVMAGQRVRTTAGMYGTVVSGDDRDVVIEIAPGVEVTMLRRAVMEVVSDDAATGDAMPSHEDIDPEQAEEPEAEYEATTEHEHEHETEAEAEPGTPDEQFGDLKDRNI
ncbi:MAG: preprotein translocase subunit YajC [Streptosporangiaceae bacterium]